MLPGAGPRAEEPPAELAVLLGNESNGSDGVFGPLTYGLEGGGPLGRGFAFEAALVGLHEPGTGALTADLDDARAALRLPAFSLASRPLTAGGTVWRNRMIDMYTTVGGAELAREGPVEATAGFYAGRASRGAVTAQFLGARMAVSGSAGSFTWEASALGGLIRSPGEARRGAAYRRTAVEVSTMLNPVARLPVGLTLAAEDRWFSFGPSGPASSPRDDLILVVELRLHLEHLIR